MLPIGILFVQGIYHDLQVFFITQEIGIGSIHKQRFDIVLPDVMGIGMLDVE